MQNNVIYIDSRSHLEVADKKHRYAKNLRCYFKEYDNITKCRSIINYSNSYREVHITNNSNSGNNVNRIEDKWTRYDPFFEWLDNSPVLPNVS